MSGQNTTTNPFEDLLGLEEVKESREQSSLKTVTHYKKFDTFLDVPDKLFVPSIQRNIIQEHLVFMRKYIQECAKANEEPIFGTIDLVLFNDNYYLVDGQHRFFAIQKEFFENKIIVPIYALIYEVQTSNEALAKSKIEDIFKLRNRGVPIPSFILSEKEEKKDLLKEINTFLETISPVIFKQIGGYTRPKININAFLENIRKTERFKSVKSLGDFRKLFNDMNLECYHKVSKMTEKQMKKYGITDHMLSIWSQYKIYVGYSKDFDFMSSEE